MPDLHKERLLSPRQGFKWNLINLMIALIGLSFLCSQASINFEIAQENYAEALLQFAKNYHSVYDFKHGPYGI